MPTSTMRIFRPPNGRVTAGFLTLITLMTWSGPETLRAEDEMKTATYTYKTVGDLRIQAEVTRRDDDELRPVVVWIHGGALMKGDRFGQWKNPLPQLLLDAGYVVVSIDYRLAPETRLPELVADVVDACAWVRARGEELFRAQTDRLAVAGGSAGGYLTLVCGYAVQPAPTVLVSLYGYGELIDDWATGPSEDPEHLATQMSDEELAAFTPGPPVSNKLERTKDVTPYYNMWRQQGRWPEMLTGWDPKTQADLFRPYRPVVNVTSKFPPTLLMHGKKDMDVNYRESVKMAEALAAAGVDHDVILLDDAEHGLRGASPETLDHVYRKALAWIRGHMDD